MTSRNQTGVRDILPASSGEGRYEDLLRASVDWVWDTDGELRLTFVSPPIARDLGLPPPHFLGRRLTELGRFESGQARDDVGDLQSRRPFRDVEVAIPDATGREVPFRISGVPYFDPATGAFAGLRGTAVRVRRQGAKDAGDDVKRNLLQTLEEVLLRHNDLKWRLRQRDDADAASREHLARLLHELRTPLNAVAGYAELARQRVDSAYDDPTLRQHLENVAEAAQHMVRLISEVDRTGRKSSKAEGEASSTGADVPDALRPVADLSQVVRDARAMTELSARRAGIRFADMEPRESFMVWGERKALTQIVVNLLGNAVKFTPAGGEVGIALRDSGGVPCLAVWDTGPGIPPEEQERIFERTYRMAHHDGVQGPAGQGLGLAIARQLAQENGADLRVESTPGEGAVFLLDVRPVETSNVA